MFFSLRYNTFEVSSDDIKFKYFKNNIMFIFISELNEKLIEVTFMLTKNIFNKSDILLKLQLLQVEIKNKRNEIQNNRNNKAVKKILLYYFYCSTR